MRFAVADRRSTPKWLWLGLGVLVWLALSVLLGTSTAHADEGGNPPAGQAHASTTTPGSDTHAAGSENRRSDQTSASRTGNPNEKLRQDRKSAQQRQDLIAAEQVAKAAPTSVGDVAEAARSTVPAAHSAVTTASGIDAPGARDRNDGSAASRPHDRHVHDARSGHSNARNGQHHARNGQPKAHARGHHVDHRSAMPLSHTHRDAASAIAHASSAPMPSAHVTPPAQAAQTAFQATPEPPTAPRAPQRGDSTAGQPAAALSASGTGTGVITPFEVTGLTSARAPVGVLLGFHGHSDDALPSGPSATTDSSPD